MFSILCVWILVYYDKFISIDGLPILGAVLVVWNSLAKREPVWLVKLNTVINMLRVIRSYES